MAAARAGAAAEQVADAVEDAAAGLLWGRVALAGLGGWLGGMGAPVIGVEPALARRRGGEASRGGAGGLAGSPPKLLNGFSGLRAG